MSLLSYVRGVLRRFRAYAEGTLFYLDANSAETPLAIGSEGQALVVSGGVPTWGAAVGAELLVEDGTAEFEFDDATGDVLYEG